MKKDEEMTNEEVMSEEETADTTEAAENSSTEDETTAEMANNSKGIIVAEVAVAAAAIGFIGYALASSGKGTTVSSDAVSQDAAAVEAAFDISELYDNQPAALDIASLNPLTEEECLANVEAGTMVKLEGENGIYVYCYNFDDPALYNAAIEVTEEEIDARIQEDILYMFPEYLDADHDVAALGDLCDISYIGTLDGVAFAGGTADNYQLELGSKTFIEGFEDGVVGMTVGETKDLTLTFPEDYYSADLAGQEVVFSVTLNKILGEEVYPEKITDAIVAQVFTDITTAKECEDYFKNVITQEKIYEYAFTNFYVSSLDQTIVDAYYDSTLKTYDMTATMYGVDLGAIITANNMTTEDFMNEINSSACESALYSEYYSVLATHFDVTVSAEDLEALALQSGYESVDQLYTDFGQQFVDDYMLQTNVMAKMTELMAPDCVLDNPTEDASTDEADEATDAEDTEATDTTTEE